MHFRRGAYFAVMSDTKSESQPDSVYCLWSREMREVF